MLAVAVEAVFLLVALPLLLLPVAVAAGAGLFALLDRPCGDPCETPGLLGMAIWAVLVITAWAGYRPLLRRLGRRTLGGWVAGRSPRPGAPPRR
jgi:hypothetical protein